ncbi:ribonuclease HII [Pseudanabaena sp. FACHB-2040]|uniref:ribonuclease HII n=1 Tax=Pseudanabaena sp. FACHB-2040 TaxID=2692859 RepID=UPI001689F0A1|nr:ribonuclease HII [Pseudanabaena sp. FACHB-2040]MBD2260297.1 ribonuclease HII [Pseudanabaena sp. FACHB-2040]
MADPAQDTCRAAGVDEVGRGALFGPVVAAAVILSDASACELISLGVRDSKQLSPTRRQVLAVAIQQLAVDCKIGLASVQEIDRLNILQASLLAMKRAILQLDPAPSLCLIDGNQRVPDLPMSQQTIVKGDQQNCAIAAASILAKVWRDTLITRLASRYPGYDLAANKGYGSLKHRQALATLGPSPQHRLSFRPCQIAALHPEQLSPLPRSSS